MKEENENQESFLRITVTAMRNWDDRIRNNIIDPEPLEKYMKQELRDVFQKLFGEKNEWFCSLYEEVKRLVLPLFPQSRRKSK